MRKLILSLLLGGLIMTELSANPSTPSTSSNKTFDISSYDTVVVCYPIWWAYTPKILYTFVESQNWSGFWQRV